MLGSYFEDMVFCLCKLLRDNGEKKTTKDFLKWSKDFDEWSKQFFNSSKYFERVWRG